MNALRNPKTTAFFWLIARLYLGYTWFASGVEKVFGDSNAVWVGANAGKAVTGVLKGAIAKSALAPGFDPITTPHPAVQTWYAMLARDVFLPHATLMSNMVAFGELLVGLALIVGIFTRFSALMGVVMALSLFLAGQASILPQLLTIGLVITLVGQNAGYYGLDSLMRPIEHIVARQFARRWRLSPTPQAV